MIRLILIRHGKTTCNESGLLSGTTDSILSEVGQLQAKKITNYLKDEKIDKIYATPFSRTINTIKELADLKNIEVQENNKLNEINFGDFESITFDEIKEKYPKEVEKMINQGNSYKYPNGESLEETFERVKDEIDKILQESQDSTVLICSHGGTIRNIISYLLSKDSKYHWNFKIDNGSITEIEIQDNFAVISKLNYTDFQIKRFEI